MRELESGREKQLYQNNNLTRLLDLSPEGERIVFGNKNVEDGTWSILIMPISGGEPRELCKLQGFGGIVLISWAPDGEYLLFSERVKEGGDLWRIFPDGREPEKLLHSDKSYAGLSIHPDGQQIAFSTFDRGLEIWVMENFLPKK
jgi:Tol biopolymer transport system component